MEYITQKMRGKAFVLMGIMSEHYEPDLDKGKFYRDTLKPLYNNAMDVEFSLKEGVCTIEEFDMYIEFLLDIAISIDVHFDESPTKFFSDIERGLKLYIKKRICSVCGKKNADIHHTIAIGMGADRGQIDHSAYPRIALCREHHTLVHMKGQQWFDKMYHVKGVLCNYHSKDDYENGVRLKIEGSNIKAWRYESVKELFGVQFKEFEQGGNDKNVIVYRMNDKEHQSLIMAEDPIKYFYENVFNEFEIVEVD